MWLPTTQPSIALSCTIRISLGCRKLQTDEEAARAIASLCTTLFDSFDKDRPSPFNLIDGSRKSIQAGVLPFSGYTLVQGTYNADNQAAGNAIVYYHDVVRWVSQGVPGALQLMRCVLAISKTMPTFHRAGHLTFLKQDSEADGGVVFDWHTDVQENSKDRKSGRIEMTSVTLLSAHDTPNTACRPALQVMANDIFRFDRPGHTACFIADSVHKTIAHTGIAYKLSVFWARTGLEPPGSNSALTRLDRSVVALQACQIGQCHILGESMSVRIASSLFDELACTDTVSHRTQNVNKYLLLVASVAITCWYVIQGSSFSGTANGLRETKKQMQLMVGKVVGEQKLIIHGTSKFFQSSGNFLKLGKFYKHVKVFVIACFLKSTPFDNIETTTVASVVKPTAMSCSALAVEHTEQPASVGRLGAGVFVAITQVMEQTLVNADLVHQIQKQESINAGNDKNPYDPLVDALLDECRENLVAKKRTTPFRTAHATLSAGQIGTPRAKRIKPSTRAKAVVTLSQPVALLPPPQVATTSSSPALEPAVPESESDNGLSTATNTLAALHANVSSQASRLPPQTDATEVEEPANAITDVLPPLPPFIVQTMENQAKKIAEATTTCKQYFTDNPSEETLWSLRELHERTVGNAYDTSNTEFFIPRTTPQSLEHGPI